MDNLFEEQNDILIPDNPISDEVNNGEIIVNPRQIKNGSLRWSHFGPMSETASAVTNTGITIGPINGKYWTINARQI